MSTETSAAPNLYRASIGTIIAFFTAIVGAIIVWSTTQPVLMRMVQGLGETGSAMLEREEVLEFVYGAIATLGFSLVLACLVLAGPARLRSLGTLVAVVIVVGTLLFVHSLLGSALPWWTIVGVGFPLIGAIAQDQLTPKV